jgi:hypothetical protein
VILAVAGLNRVGTWNFASYSQGEGGVLRMDVMGPSEADRLELSGTATLSGGLDLDWAGFEPTAPLTIHLIGASSISGRFTTVQDLPQGWRLIYTARFVDLASPVPDGPTYWMMGGGCIALAGLARRRSRFRL